jgi:hypothetical protein
MNKIEFDALVELKITDLIDQIMDRKDLDFEEAIAYLYSSALYRLLVDEDSKLWHLSDEKLFGMLIDEKENKKLTLPDYV